MIRGPSFPLLSRLVLTQGHSALGAGWGTAGILPVLMMMDSILQRNISDFHRSGLGS